VKREAEIKPVLKHPEPLLRYFDAKAQKRTVTIL